jgi:hypothetical protein
MFPLNIIRRVEFTRDSVGGEIAEARNNLVAKCLRYENDKVELDSIFWLDDDVLPTRGALVKLYDHHVPVAAGAYFLKGDPTLPLIFPGRGAGTAKFAPNHVGPMWGVIGGLTLVKGGVYKALAEHVGKDKYGRPEWYKTDKEYTVEDGLLNCGGTEDLYFCNLLPKIGVTPLVDCTKHAFGFHYDMETNKGYPLAQFAQWSQAKPVTWETDNGTVTWE